MTNILIGNDNLTKVFGLNFKATCFNDESFHFVEKSYQKLVLVTTYGISLGKVTFKDEILICTKVFVVKCIFSCSVI